MQKWIAMIVLSVFVCLHSTQAGMREGSAEAGSGTVNGRIGIKGVGPMMQGIVFFFDALSGPPPSATKYWRVPVHVFTLDGNARFSATVPEGSYYLGAMETESGAEFSPPQDGGYYLLSRDGEGKPKLLTVWKDSVIDLGILNEAEQFKKASVVKKGMTAISGKLRDDHGRPLEGITVLAFSGGTGASRRPLFVSDLSDKDGVYQLRLQKGGTYYLLAHARPGMPSPAEISDLYLTGKPVAVKTGLTRTGVNITIYTGE